MTRKRLLVRRSALVLGCALGLAVSGASQATESARATAAYVVHAGCTFGENTNHSWLAMPSSPGMIAYSNCRFHAGDVTSGNGIVTRTNTSAALPYRASARMNFTAPPGTAITAVRYRMSRLAGNPQNPHNGPFRAQLFNSAYQGVPDVVEQGGGPGARPSRPATRG